jgi:uncharacterized protein YbjT (DUF2867 family)
VGCGLIATIAGGTGLTGSFLVRRLLADSAITKVISVSRSSLKIPHAKLTEFLISDLADLLSIASKIRGEIYFCCLGTTIGTAGSKENFEKVDHAAIVAFAKIAKSQDAKSFTLVSAMGANPNSMFFYNRVKGRTENDVKATGLRSLIVFKPAAPGWPASRVPFGGKHRGQDAGSAFAASPGSNPEEPYYGSRDSSDAHADRGKSHA